MVFVDEEMSGELKEDLRRYGFDAEYIDKLIRIIDVLDPSNRPIGIYIDQYSKIIVYKY